jgi:hypothetical protein
MKLRNNKTGEIVVFGEGIVDLNQIGCKNVAEMIEAGWKDYEERKWYWYISDVDFNRDTDDGFAVDKKRKEIGNYFETKEQAEKAVEKLKAWTRLKDKGFKWRYYAIGDGGQFRAYFSIKDGVDIGADLDLLFGGEE